MSVATASPAAPPGAVGGVGTAASVPPKTTAPTHSILRPCNAKGIPIGPAVIPPPKPRVMTTHTPKVHRSASITVGALKNTGRMPLRGGGSGIRAPAPTPATVSPAQTPAPAPPAQATVASPASAVSAHPGSSTDSLGSSEPSTSSLVTTESTLASSAASNDLWEEESVGTSDSTPRSSMLDGASPKIRFGHLPERPADLRRRNSITLGVLARKNMLSAQGTTGGPQKTSGTIKVMMTDAEWEEYQRKFAAKNNQATPVDIGQVMSTGAKKLFSKFSRRGSNASVASTGSNTSQVSGANRARSDSATSGAAPVSPRVGPVDVAPAIVEEEEPHSAPGSPGGPGGALHLSSMPRRGSLDALGGGAGDETPRMGRSPSPPGMHHLPPGHRQRSPSPPPHPDEDEDEDEQDDEDEDDSNEDEEEQEEYTHDDADGQYEETHSHSTAAALGFELSDYNQNKRPSWSSDNSRNNNTGHAVHQIPGFHHANDPTGKQVAAAANEISSHPRSG